MARAGTQSGFSEISMIWICQSDIYDFELAEQRESFGSANQDIPFGDNFLTRRRQAILVRTCLVSTLKVPTKK